jgi:hypothetical protein
MKYFLSTAKRGRRKKRERKGRSTNRRKRIRLVVSVFVVRVGSKQSCRGGGG